MTYAVMVHAKASNRMQCDFEGTHEFSGEDCKYFEPWLNAMFDPFNGIICDVYGRGVQVMGDECYIQRRSAGRLKILACVSNYDRFGEECVIVHNYLVTLEENKPRTPGEPYTQTEGDLTIHVKPSGHYYGKNQVWSTHGIDYTVSGPVEQVEDWYDKLERRYPPAGYSTYRREVTRTETQLTISVYHSTSCD